MISGRPVRFRAILLLSAALAGIVLLAGTPGSARGWELVVERGDAVRRFPLPTGSFELSWIHSVERTEWRETYVVDRAGAIVLVASEFASGGAGLPDRVGTGETFRETDGRMRIGKRHIRIGRLRVRLSDISHHWLRVCGSPVDLTAAFGEGAVTIRAEPSLSRREGGHR
jgi:hypothetical protein